MEDLYSLLLTLFYIITLSLGYKSAVMSLCRTCTVSLAYRQGSSILPIYVASFSYLV